MDRRSVPIEMQVDLCTHKCGPDELGNVKLPSPQFPVADHGEIPCGTKVNVTGRRLETQALTSPSRPCRKKTAQTREKAWTGSLRSTPFHQKEMVFDFPILTAPRPKTQPLASSCRFKRPNRYQRKKVAHNRPPSGSNLHLGRFEINRSFGLSIDGGSMSPSRLTAASEALNRFSFL